MKDDFDTAFDNLILSYVIFSCSRMGVGLTEEEVERALRAHAKQWGGCISCRYSLCHPEAGSRKGNPWLQRICQVGLTQDGCQMYKPFPEEASDDQAT